MSNTHEHTLLLLHAFSQHPVSQLNKTINTIGVTGIYLLDYMPSGMHPYIKRVLEKTKARFPRRVVRKTSLGKLVRKSRRVYAFESLNKELDSFLTAAGVQLLAPLWFVSPAQVREWFRERVYNMNPNGSKAKTRTTQQAFYRQQVQALGIPARFKESTDKQNRSSLPMDSDSGHVQQVSLPLTPEQAEQAMYVFLDKRFREFARYQDAVAPEHGVVLYHSCLSAALNTGLLLPQQVALAVIDKGFSNNSEAFLRQLLGWREYAICYYKYTLPKLTNFPRNKRKLSPVWYADTCKGILKAGVQRIPIIWDILEATWQHGYIHHILRLFLLSFMVQLELHPEEIYQWMMQHFVDANDWVMSFNVYAMGYFDKRFTPKAYIFSSNYMVEQSRRRYKRCPYLDSLYARFMEKNPQPRLRSLSSGYDHALAREVIAVFTR